MNIHPASVMVSVRKDAPRGHWTHYSEGVTAISYSEPNGAEAVAYGSGLWRAFPEGAGPDCLTIEGRAMDIHSASAAAESALGRWARGAS